MSGPTGDSLEQWTTTIMRLTIDVARYEEMVRHSNQTPNLATVDDLVAHARGHLAEVKETIRDVRVHDLAALALARSRNLAGVAYARAGEMMVALAYFNANDPWGKFHDLPDTREGQRLTAMASRNYGIASILSGIPNIAGLAYMSLESSAFRYWQLEDRSNWAISIILAALSRSYKTDTDTHLLQEAVGYLSEDSRYAAIGRALMMPGRHTARGVRDAKTQIGVEDFTL
jgi:hypothetical protein